MAHLVRNCCCFGTSIFARFRLCLTRCVLGSHRFANITLLRNERLKNLSEWLIFYCGNENFYRKKKRKLGGYIAQEMFYDRM